ncbi:MAG: GAP family protein [Propionibacteriaceae bacterium]|nr:GAP family protein [Propionibacteriaceae bacterium]
MVATLGSLAVLALIDSTSFGTLLIPVWLLTAPGRLRIGRVLLFVGVVASTYFAVGLALMLGAATLLNGYNRLLESSAFHYAQFAAGIVLLVISHLMDTKKARTQAAERADHGGGRIMGWRAQIMRGESSSGSAATLLGLALTAVLIEVTTMLPYLAGIGIITVRGPGWPGNAVLLLGYCLVMILPALVLTAGRVLAGSTLETPLKRLDSWLTKHAQATTAWVIGIVGFIIAAQAAHHLWF